MADRATWTRAEPLGMRAATTPNRTALVDATGEPGESRVWSYRALDAAADAVAHRLEEHLPAPAGSTGASGPRRIGVAVSPRVAFVTTLYAALRLGWTVAPLDPAATAAESSERVDRLEPALLVCERGSEEQCNATGYPVVSVDEPADTDVPSLSVASDSVPTDDRTPGDGERGQRGRTASHGDAVVMFTSGTTGQPTGVRLTLRNLLASAVGSAFRLGVTPSDRWLGCLPVHHMGGLAPVFRSVWYGTTLVLQGSFDTDRTAELLRSRSVTGVSLVPTQLTRLLDAGWSPPASLRAVLLGGAPAGEELLSRALEAGVPVCPTYGLTEAASQVATASPGTAREHPESVGQPLAWTEVTLVEGGEPGERGEVVLDGPTITPGYLDASATEAAFGPWGLHTGDLAARDADGRLRILGRLDDVINTGGELVAPSEVVPALESHPAVAEAAVVGVEDPEWGERVAALVVPEQGEPAPDTEELREHAGERLSAYKLPKTVAAAPQLPRTASGTVDREAVAAEIRRQRENGG